ncbi:MAG TPA: SAM-dependent methyltransferase [Burkholderiales bacterium]|jgi:SAM-dependent MidA family methyltransferase|nr:SAM-dependent methyltransferase [Burkholderiales bacterium]
MRPAELPPPDPDALAASRRLLERIGAELEARDNWMSFARYMELALHEPGLGYYAAGSRKLGPAGDFVTAPELSPLFARTLARQIAQILQPGESVLEFGAGSGALAEVLLQELSVPYAVLETSPELKERQRERLGDRVRWLERLPRNFRGVMIANEVLDAMPVHAIAWTNAGILERGVCINEHQLAWCDRPAHPEIASSSRKITIDLPPSGRYESELALLARLWMRSLGRILERGAILVIDYGFPEGEYFHPQRSMGTLACHYRHHVHADPFYLPGLQDITAHVDFSALARSAREGGLEVLGYATQAQFLVNCGITEVLAQQNADDAARYLPAAAAAQKLLSPSEMGELFKVLAAGKGVERPLMGFASGNRQDAL